MSRLTTITLSLACLFVTFYAAYAFTPLEFLQHIQQQQQQAQQLQQIQQPHQAPQAPPVQQPVEQQTQQPKEVFKPFHGKGPLMLKGCFTFANETSNDERLPSFRVYFKGKETRSDEEGFFSIPVDEENLEQYTLVITKNLQQDFDKHNTIKGLKLLPNKNYKCYTCQKHFGNQWVRHEGNLGNKHLMLPDNALVILVDPKYVDHLDEWNLNLRNNFITLPKIVLKKEIKHKPTERAAAKSLLTSLDATVFHEEVREEIKQPTAKVKIALAH